MAATTVRLRSRVIGGCVGAALLCAAHAAAPERQAVRAGHDLFVGNAPLRGRIRTHLVDLPPEVVRCGNCHAAADGPDVPRSLAPRLTPALLLEPRARRGGPASSYDREKFCKLLRDGVDPAYVLISVEMPLYALDDAQCRALWRFLTWRWNDSKPG